MQAYGILSLTQALSVDDLAAHRVHIVQITAYSLAEDDMWKSLKRRVTSTLKDRANVEILKHNFEYAVNSSPERRGLPPTRIHFVEWNLPGPPQGVGSTTGIHAIANV